jgi:hypothetical protein
MSRIAIVIAAALAFAAIVFACVLNADPAQAQVRVFVAATGSDSNPCTFTSPCRTFQHAHDTVAANGEINALDPAGYGPLTITKPISIQGHGFAEISVPNGGTGITISAGFGDIISLRGLILDGTGGGTLGILFDTALSLTVVDCVARNMITDGLRFVSNATTTQSLAVSNSYFTDNNIGIQIRTANSGTVVAAIDRTGMYGNSGNGLFVNGFGGTGGLFVAVTDSVAANNGFAGLGSGFEVASTTGHSISNLSLTHSLVEGNIIGVQANGPASTLWLAQSTLTGNASGFSTASGGVINTYLDNYNTSNGAGTGSLTPVGKQ